MKDHTLPASLFWWCNQGLESTLVAILPCQHFCKDASVAQPMQHSNELESFPVEVILMALMISILFAAIRLVVGNKNLHVLSCSASVYCQPRFQNLSIDQVHGSKLFCLSFTQLHPSLIFIYQTVCLAWFQLLLTTTCLLN